MTASFLWVLGSLSINCRSEHCRKDASKSLTFLTDLPNAGRHASVWGRAGECLAH